MNRTMITATNTLSQLQKQMDIISNNMANIDTAGYKRREASFTDLLVQEFANQPDPSKENFRVTPNYIRQGTGAKLGQVQLVLTQGNLKTTDRTLDTAFTVDNQFYRVMVQNEDGTSSVNLTRNGAFYLSPISDQESVLVNSDGHAMLDENNQPIIISGNVKNFRINANGLFAAEMYDGSSQEVNLGVVLVKKPQFLEQKGGNLLGMPNSTVAEEDIMTELTGPLRGQIAIQQGVLEQSNVDMSKEMTDLITVQRSYQFHAKTITLADQMLGLVNGIR